MAKQKQTKNKFLEQYYVNLKSDYSEIDSNRAATYKDAKDKIDSLFNEDMSWKNAYEIARLFVLLYNDNKVDIEIKRLLVDIKVDLGDDIYQFYSQEIQTNDINLDYKRELLAKMIEDCQWGDTKKYTNIELNSNISLKYSIIYIVSFICFSLTFFIFYFLFINSTKDSNLLKSIVFFDKVVIAIVSGILGASFSLLIKSRTTDLKYNELLLFENPFYIISRILIGSCAALLMFFFFYSGLLRGALFPAFQTNILINTSDVSVDVIKSTNIDISQIALLIIWCFLAGFSESLIPNLLMKTEKQVEDQVGKNTQGTPNQ